MGFLSGLGGPLLTQAAQGLGAYNAGQKQQNDQNVAHSLQLLMLKRQADQEAMQKALGMAQINHLNSQAEGQWGQAFAGQDENGPGMFQQHKLTGEVRRAMVGGSTVPGGSPATNAATNPTSSNAGGRATDAMGQDVPGDINLNDPRFNMTPTDTTPPKQASGPTGGVLRPLPKVTQPRAPTTVATTKGIAQWNPDTQKWEQTGMQPHEPPPTNVYTTGVDPNTKQPTIFAGPSKGTPTLTNLNVGKPTAAGGGGQSLSPQDRAKMLAQAQLDNATMKRIEARVLNGDLQFGTAAGLAGAAAGAHGSPLNEAVGVLGNAAAGALDPDIQQYFTANDSYGRIMGNLQSKRYTDNQAMIEKKISGMKGNDLRNTIAYKQQLRDASLADPDIQPTQTPSGGRGAGGVPTQGVPKTAPKKDHGIFGPGGG